MTDDIENPVLSGPDDNSTENDARTVQRTDYRLREAVQELLRTGVIDQSGKPDAYHMLLAQPTPVNGILEPLDLEMSIDEVRGLVYIVINRDYAAAATDDAWTHPLVRRDRLNLEQSLMVAMLRRHFIAHETEAGIGSAAAVVDIDDLIPELNQFMGTSGSETQDENRVRNLLEQLKRHGIVGDVDASHQIRISPLIAHLANPTSLDQLLAAMKAQNPEVEEPTS